jgi:hypothetical protein
MATKKLVVLFIIRSFDNAKISEEMCSSGLKRSKMVPKYQHKIFGTKTNTTHRKIDLVYCFLTGCCIGFLTTHS